MAHSQTNVRKWRRLVTLDAIRDGNYTPADLYGWLQFSISYCHDVELMKAIVSQGACVNFPDPLPKGNTVYSPLHSCVVFDMVEGISPLVAAGADVNIRTHELFQATPLHLAIAYQNTEAARELLQNGADPYCLLQGISPKTRNHFSQDCFEFACYLEGTEEIRSLFSQYKYFEDAEIKLDNGMQWSKEPRAKKWMFEPIAVHLDDDIFVGERRRSYDQFLYIFNIYTRKWTPLAFHSFRTMYGFTLAVANHHVHVLAGSWKKKEMVEWSKDVFSLDYSYTWHENLPPMKIARIYAAAVSFDDFIVVAGGIGSNNSWLSSVEVLDTSKKVPSWWQLPHFPVRSDLMQSTVTKDMLFFGCGSGSDKKIYASKKIKIRKLLGASLTHLNGFSKVGPEEPFKEPPVLLEDFWQPLCPAPLNRSGLTAVNGCLLTVGGRDGDGKHQKAVYMYNECTRTWTQVSQIAKGRYYPAALCVTLDSSQELFVFFGCGAENSVEFCRVLL